MKTLKPNFKTIRTPIGNLVAVADDEGVCFVGVESEYKPVQLAMSGKKKAAKHLKILEGALKKYFKGKSSALSKVPLSVKGTVFQRKVWEEMRKIPAGKTLTYGELAKKVGRPLASRAVGTACGRNPVLLITPCHRVVGCNGLGGFSAGLKMKEFLLDLEATR